jgi:hypothetical protein
MLVRLIILPEEQYCSPQEQMRRYIQTGQLERQAVNCSARFSQRFPDAPEGTFLTSYDAWRHVFCGAAFCAGVTDFFAVLLRDGGNGFVFQINEFRHKLQRVLRAFLDTFLAPVTSVCIYNYEVFT